MKLLKEGNLENALLSLFCGSMPNDAEICTSKGGFSQHGLLFCFFILYVGDRVD